VLAVVGDSSGDAAPGERKRQLLGMLADNGEMTTTDIVGQVGITRTTVCRHMNRYRRHGDVQIEGGEFAPGRGKQENTYSLTSAGADKVEYYRSQE